MPPTAASGPCESHERRLEVGSTLRRLGFEAPLLVNARKADIDAALVRYRSLVAGADVGLFYYSGHGFQTGATGQHHPVNHLVPIDFRIPTGKVLEGTVALDEVLGLWSRAPA